MNNEHLVELTADIVTAHVSNNQVAISDIGLVVQRIHETLAALGREPAAEERVTRTPAVSKRASIKPDYLVCLQCGRRQKTLKRHLTTAHGLTPDRYRADFDLGRDYPMVSRNYSEARRAMAKAIGLGRKKGATAASSRKPPTNAGRKGGVGARRKAGAKPAA